MGHYAPSKTARRTTQAAATEARSGNYEYQRTISRKTSATAKATTVIIK